jgi:protein O-GlcNAc transferase
MSKISDQLLRYQQANQTTNLKWPLRKACQAIALGRYHEAEAYLLAEGNRADQEEEADRLWLLAQIRNQRTVPSNLKRIYKALLSIAGPDDPRAQHIYRQIAREQQGQSPNIDPCDLKRLTGGRFPHLDFEIISGWLEAGRLDIIETALMSTGHPNSCEALLLQCRYLRARNNLDAAQALIEQHLPTHRHRIDYQFAYIELLFDLQRGDKCLPSLHTAFEIRGQLSASPLLERFAQARLLQRQPAPALRAKLQERLPKIYGLRVSKPTTAASAYDLLGRSSWLGFLSSRIFNHPSLYLELYSNLLMHLSSTSSRKYIEAAKELTAAMTLLLQRDISRWQFKQHQSSTNILRIGWICGDICNHPVSRFLLSWLAAAHGCLHHKHIVVGITPGDERYTKLFSELPGVEYKDLSGPTNASSRINQLRDLALDIAIDLNGWTGNNFAPGFIARIAPLQLNYLAYHASTGIPAMDVWLVDDHVVTPEPLAEWHTETVVRLPRPFLAWQPHPELPEAKAEITQPAFEISAGIRFGCFNNLRKISDQALQCWSRILRAVPGSALVLKAHSAEDTATATLLERRLQRCHLPLQQVIWLPYTATPDEHLQQYAHMDVALDSFPNTGCTTTCEALWMGVPVITLEGNHYVSRMAAAVLHAAQLPEWICGSLQAYEHLAIAQSSPERLAWLRSHRAHWRHQIQASPLGDAQDLIRELERCFSDLARQRLAEQALQLTGHPPGIVQG